MKNYTCLFILFLAIISCKESKENIYEEIVINPNNTIKRFDLGEIIDSSKFELVALEANENCMINEISTIRIFNNKIYIGDYVSHSIFEFSLDGKFLRKLRKLGRTREEYFNLTYFDIDEINNQLIILDHVSGKYNIYDLNDFRFKTSQKIRNTIWANEITRVKDKLIFINPKSRTNSGYFHLFVQDEKRFVPSLPFDEKDSDIGWVLDQYHCNMGDSLLLYFSPRDSIYLYDGQKSYLKYVVNFTANKAPLSIIEGDGREALEYFHKSDMIGSIDNVNQLEDYLIIRFENGCTRYTFYSESTKETTTSEYFVLESFANFPICNYERHKDYFTAHISAGTFSFFYSDEVMDSRNASFCNNAVKNKMLEIRNNLNDMSNPVILYAKLK